MRFSFTQTLLALAVFTLSAHATAKDWEENPQLRVRIMDKVTATTKLYDLNVNRTVAYGNLRIRPKTCRKTGPLDEPEAASFLQIWEVDPAITSIEEQNKQGKWLFSGWMFASSPSLSSLDHPVYDVWLIDCINPNAKAEPVEAPAPEGEAAAKADAAKKAEDAAPQTNEQSTDNASESLD